jgi:hypothetical protein
MGIRDASGYIEIDDVAQNNHLHAMFSSHDLYIPTQNTEVQG